MKIVVLTALGVGGATVMGSVIGFALKDISHRFCGIVMAFAAGVMLAAAVLGLILPSVEYGSLFITLSGIFAGALCVDILDRLIPVPDSSARKHQVILFVTAIAIHNLPEGIAAGVSFGTGSIREAMFIAGGIALQNIPEGLVIIAPMLSAGFSPGKTFLIALLTGLVEVAGTLLGYCAITLAEALLPFALAFAGGTMIFVIIHDMVSEPHPYSLLAGFCLMLACDALLG